MQGLWLRHDASLAHDIPGHPERPERLRVLEAAMERAGWFGWDVADAPAATREQLERVHPAAHVDFVEEACARGAMIDQDTACMPETWPAALHAAGGAVALVDALLSGAAPFGFSALRPPGHHAESDRAMGFCFFDSVAVGAAHALASGRAPRVMVFDWDVHHGNGTSEIFHASSDVLFVSVHQWPLYPLGSGPASDVGSGPGEGHTVNLPVPPGSGDEVFCGLVDEVVVPLARSYEPSLVLISAGFDAHELDPLASCRVTEHGFARMTASLRDICGELGVPLGLVLEGGYSTEALAASVSALMPVLGGAGAAEEATAQAQVPGVVREARARVARWWPALA